MDINNSAASSASLIAKQQQRKAGRNTRVPLSCGPCRTRKLKCNREEPCQNCLVRKEPQTCTYTASRGPATAAPPSRRTHVESMQERIDRLESLVTRMASQGLRHQEQRPISPETTASSTLLTPSGKSPSMGGRNDHQLDDIGHGVGVLSVSEGGSLYRGSTYWGDVFQEINELKTVWSQVLESTDYTNINTASAGLSRGGPPILLRQFKTASFEEIIATVPAKPVVDKILERFFDVENSPVPIFHILHRNAFLQQYEDYCASPLQTKPMWVGLLFSILSLVMLSYFLLEDEPPEFEGCSERLYDLYRLRTAQCLTLGDVTKCAPYTVETLLFHCLGEQSRCSDSGTGVWILWGMIVRIALQMGYHRDPAQYPDISLFQGELRRRVWHLVLRLDGIFSFQVGLPSMVRPETYDTQTPRNIYDWELTESTVELPPTRPKTDITPISYLLAKDSILKVLGDIVDLLSSLHPYSYDKVLKLDDELSLAQTEIPPHLHMRPLSASLNDSASLISRRVQLEVLFHQGMCVLHRKFMAQGRLDGRFEPSRNRCIRSAMALLSVQDLLYQEARGTADERARFTKHWYRFSFISQDFILAAMILCLDLRHRRVAEAANGKSLPGTDYSDETITVAIKRAFEIWHYAQKTLPDATKVYRVLAHMLEMLGISQHVDSQPQQNDVFAGQPHIGSLWGPHTNINVDIGIYENQVPMDTMSIDWAMWDSFIEGTSFDDAFGSMLTPPTTNSTTNALPDTGMLEFGIGLGNLEFP